MKPTPEEQNRWRARVRSVNKDRRKQLITDAHEIGKLSYREIAEALGDVSRQRVMAIVKEIRQGRES